MKSILLIIIMMCSVLFCTAQEKNIFLSLYTFFIQPNQQTTYPRNFLMSKGCITAITWCSLIIFFSSIIYFFFYWPNVQSRATYQLINLIDDSLRKYRSDYPESKGLENSSKTIKESCRLKNTDSLSLFCIISIAILITCASWNARKLNTSA